MKKRWFVFGMLALALVLATAAPSVFAGGPVTGRAARAEVRYLEGMIDHHQMALDMANDCLAKAEAESIRTLCQNIIDAQSAEIDAMRGWLQDWYAIDYTPMPMMRLMEMMQSTGMMMGGTMMGQGGQGSGMGQGGMGQGGMMGNAPFDPPLMMGMMSGLSSLSGRDYEIGWLEAMIDHHDDAINMSQRVLQYAEHEELRVLAQQIIDDQTAEIESMEGLITELSAPA